jgi:parvulin-like peptidyl-prolyl isomerase
MEQLREELEADADFEAIARRESDSQSRFRGGLIGNVEVERLRPEIRTVADALDPGGISDVIETEDGFTILKCDTILEAHVPTEDEARSKIALNLRRLHAKELWEKKLEELVAQEAPEFDLEAAVDRETSADTTVARYRSGELSRAGLAAIASGRPGAHRAGDINEKRARSILESWVAGVAATREVDELDLGDDPALRGHREWTRRQILATEQLRRRVQGELTPPTEAEIRAYFDENRNDFRAPARYRLAVIRIDTTQEELRKIHQRARTILDDLRAGRLGFAAAARSVSDHPSAENGGDLGWLARPRVAGWGPELLRTITDLEPGQVSDIVRVDDGLWIVQLLDEERARELEYDQARGAAERRLGTERARELQRRFEGDLRWELDVAVVNETD